MRRSVSFAVVCPSQATTLTFSRFLRKANKVSRASRSGIPSKARWRNFFSSSSEQLYWEEWRYSLAQESFPPCKGAIRWKTNSFDEILNAGIIYDPVSVTPSSALLLFFVAVLTINYEFVGKCARLIHSASDCLMCYPNSSCRPGHNSNRARPYQLSFTYRSGSQRFLRCHKEMKIPNVPVNGTA